MNLETLKWILSAVVVISVQVANYFGAQVTEDLATQIVLGIFALIALGWGLWKNHNFTKAAQIAQELLDGLKSGAIQEISSLDDLAPAESSASVQEPTNEE